MADDSKAKTKSIKQTAIFNAPPKEVYGMLMDSKKHSDFTGSKANISSKVGGKFSAWDGYNYGENLRLVEGKLIEQTWRADDWPDGAVSKVVFKLEPAAKGKKTKLNFVQTGVPASFAKDISDGWKEYYWKNMEEYIEKAKTGL
jgi:activator of HSP90 ATPase